MADQGKHRRASLYLRISVASDESDSLERQERDLRALAAQEGFDVAEVRRDEGVSGAAVERPAFRLWLRDATEGRADVLLAWRFDRISREGLSAVARILDVLKETGARLLTYGDRMDSDSAAFRLTAAVLSEVAYAERQSIKARVSSRQAADRRKGAWTKERPYGYDVVQGRLVQRPEEAAILRDLVERFLAGASLRGLARHLSEQGIPTPRATKGRKTRAGATWGLTTVRALLAAPTLAGYYPHKGRPLRDEEGDLVLVTDAPILTPGEWADVTARLEARASGPVGRRRPAVGTPPAHPLSGLLRCGGCGGAVVYDSRRSNDRKPLFRCQRTAHSPNACAGLFVKADALEEALAYRVLRYVPALDPDGPEADAVIRRFLRAAEPGQDQARRQAEALLETAKARLQDLEDARYERGEFSDTTGPERYRRLHERLQVQVRHAEAELGALPDPGRNVGGLFDREVLRETLENGSDEARRALYEVVMERVEVAPGRGSEDLDARIRPVWASPE